MRNHASMLSIKYHPTRNQLTAPSMVKIRVGQLIFALSQCITLTLAAPTQDLAMVPDPMKIYSTPLKVIMKVPNNRGTNKLIDVTVWINNPSDRTYKILNSPTSFFDTKSGAERFNPESKASKEKPRFLGKSIKWLPEKALELGKFTIIGPGKTVHFRHKLENLYDFGKPGSGIYTLRPSELILIADSQNNIALAKYSSLPPIDITISVARSFVDDMSDQLVLRALNSTAHTDAIYIDGSCSAASLPRNAPQMIKASAELAKAMAKRAQTHLNGNIQRQEWSSQLKKWFGKRGAVDIQTLQKDLNSIAGEDYPANYKFYCDCSQEDIDQGTYAWVQGAPRFYPKVRRATTMSGSGLLISLAPRAAGTIIHESSHFWDVARTIDDGIYGPKACQALAKSNPVKAQKTADNIQFYAESVYFKK
ncbi:Zincin [Ceratobasidium theobromae]|uniref:Zincin n=1 Tax=Ceratobasidium theobromae TaxID=1582974 RepID=A0A5N5QBX4_9AGAM|nr:Zincin [Ceratobasidium theobromae]